MLLITWVFILYVIYVIINVYLDSKHYNININTHFR